MNKYIKSLFYPLTFLIYFVSVWSFAQEAIDYGRLGGEVDLKVRSLIEKDPKLQNLEILPKGEVYIPPGASEQVQEKLKRVAAYDVGSTGVKFKVADVDPAALKIVNAIYSTTVPTKFEINEEDFLDRIAIMAGLKTLVDEYFPHYSEVEHHAVATAGFRAAGERGLRLAKEIADFTGIDFKVIDQDYEGLLAYYGVLAQEPAFDAAKDIVWDIGGGSSQLVANEAVGDKERLKFMGIGVGGAKFNKFVLDMKQSGDSPNPMSFEQMGDIIHNNVSNFLKLEGSPFSPVFSENDINFIKSKISNGGKVYGIGAIHNFVAQLYVNNNLGAKKYYTKDDILNILEMMADHDDDYIFSNVKKDKKADPKFTKFDTTSLILVYSMMDLFGIERVYPVNVSNADGIIIKSVIDSENANKEVSEEEIAIL